MGLGRGRREDRMQEDILNKVDKSKRDFLKKVVIGTTFTVPLIQSFSMDGLRARAAYAKHPPTSPHG